MFLAGRNLQFLAAASRNLSSVQEIRPTKRRFLILSSNQNNLGRGTTGEFCSEMGNFNGSKIGTRLSSRVLATASSQRLDSASVPDSAELKELRKKLSTALDDLEVDFNKRGRIVSDKLRDFSGRVVQGVQDFEKSDASSQRLESTTVQDKAELKEWRKNLLSALDDLEADFTKRGRIDSEKLRIFSEQVKQVVEKCISATKFREQAETLAALEEKERQRKWKSINNKINAKELNEKFKENVILYIFIVYVSLMGAYCVFMVIDILF